MFILKVTHQNFFSIIYLYIVSQLPCVELSLTGFLSHRFCNLKILHFISIRFICLFSYTLLIFCIMFHFFPVCSSHSPAITVTLMVHHHSPLCSSFLCFDSFLFPTHCRSQIDGQLASVIFSLFLSLFSLYAKWQ